ncbi:uncharacterized protein LOC113280438 [Papaver somniferum]|uniref:uncharacterized protein LOC113280438 n=1 Tax=Papaver somniferum TaxID=3469 RepID=UPI000E6F54E2|nr:uncharacterized protein LOC113280438 [Papaver somniferum]
MGTYVNGVIYWISSKNVVAFDLADEEFRLLTAPSCMQDIQQKHRYGLVALGRHLCLYMDKSRLEIWSLMRSSNSKETWCMEFNIDYESVVGSFSRDRFFQPVLLTKGGEIIFLYDKSVLYWYDTRTTLLRMISDEAATNYFRNVEVIAHTSTFASLEAMGENSKRYTLRPRRVRTPWDAGIDELDRVALGEEIDTTRFRLR